MSVIIGLCGHAGSGKTRIANELISHLGSGKIIPLAKSLKEITFQATGLMKGLSNEMSTSLFEFESVIEKYSQKRIPNLAQYYAKIKNFRGDKARYALQLIGTEIFREKVDNSFWVKKTESEIKKLKEKYILVDDVRYENEASMIQSFGFGLLIGVSTDYDIIAKRTGIGLERLLEMYNHRSEQEIDSIHQEHCDFLVNNNKQENFIAVCAAVDKIVNSTPKRRGLECGNIFHGN